MGYTFVPPPNGCDTLDSRLKADLRRVGWMALLDAIRGMVGEGSGWRSNVQATVSLSGQVSLEDEMEPAPASPATPPGGWFAEGTNDLEDIRLTRADGWLHETVNKQLNDEIAEVEKSLVVELVREVDRAKIALCKVVRRNIEDKKRLRYASRPLMLLRVCLCVSLAPAAIAFFPGDGCSSDGVFSFRYRIALGFEARLLIF
jgi:hypothetical protein